MNRRLSAMALVVLFIGLSCLSQGSAYWQSRVQVSVGAAAYSGPGDIVSGATVWYGFRAYSSAKRGNAAINVCNVADVVCGDLSTDATTGDLVVSTIGGSNCSIVTCTIKIIYDQTQASNCGAANCNASEATIGNRPTFVVSCQNGKPCMACPGDLITANNLTAVNQALTVSEVTIRTGTFTSTSITSNFGGNIETYYTTSANTKGAFAGSVGTATAADSSWHAVQTVFNNASSIIYVDGSSNTVTTGTNATAGSIRLCAAGIGSQSLTGNFAELGMWPSAFSAGNMSSMNSNQRTYWGF